MGATGTAWPAAAPIPRGPLVAAPGLPEPPIEDDFGDLDVLAGDAFSDKPESLPGLDSGGPARVPEGGAQQPQKPGQPNQVMLHQDTYKKKSSCFRLFAAYSESRAPTLHDVRAVGPS